MLRVCNCLNNKYKWQNSIRFKKFIRLIQIWIWLELIFSKNQIDLNLSRLRPELVSSPDPNDLKPEMIRDQTTRNSIRPDPENPKPPRSDNPKSNLIWTQMTQNLRWPEIKRPKIPTWDEPEWPKIRDDQRVDNPKSDSTWPGSCCIYVSNYFKIVSYKY
jgi:hypothetical protein